MDYAKRIQSVPRNLLQKNNYDKLDLRKKNRDRRPALIPLIIRSDDMGPKKYEHLNDAANDNGVPYSTLIYTYDNRRSLITWRKPELRSFTSSGSREIRNWGILEQTTPNNAIVRMVERVLS